jgi:hypothetical protein
MGSSSNQPWYQNPLPVGVLLALMVLLVVLVWIVGIGAAFIETVGFLGR